MQSVPCSVLLPSLYNPIVFNVVVQILTGLQGKDWCSSVGVDMRTGHINSRALEKWRKATKTRNTIILGNQDHIYVIMWQEIAFSSRITGLFWWHAPLKMLQSKDNTLLDMAQLVELIERFMVWSLDLYKSKCPWARYWTLLVCKWGTVSSMNGWRLTCNVKKK